MPSSNLTTEEIVALRGLNRRADERWVEWAIEMLVAGKDTPALRRLAGETAPFNPHEMGAVFDAALRQLGIPAHSSPRMAALALGEVRVRQLLAGARSAAAVLSELCQVCVELGMLDDLFDFYLLHYAREDLDAVGYQYYVDGLTRHNVDDVTKETCELWLRRCGRRREE